MLVFGPYLSQHGWMRFVFQEDGTLISVDQLECTTLPTDIWLDRKSVV